jgi:hypothetical protein
MKTRITLTALVAAAVLAGIVGCSQPVTPPEETPSPTAPVTVEVSPTPTPTPTPTYVIPTVAEPWQPGQFQEGIQIYWHANGEPIGSVMDRADQIMDYVVSTGANSVGITFPIYTDGPWPTRVYVDAETPTVDELTRVIAAAKERKLRVLLRASIDEANIMSTQDEWRGSISPQDVRAWFDSYIETLTPYWKMAKATGTDEVSLGVELTSLESQVDRWNGVRQAASGVFPGTLSYAINWNEYESGGPIDSLAVDAYPRIELGDDASVEQLVAAWNEWLALRPVESRRTIVLQEVGIPAESGKYARPWSWGDDTALNLAVQANWFAASCQAARQSETAGIYYWMIDSNIDFAALNPETDPVGSFVGRPAEDSLKACFA